MQIIKQRQIVEDHWQYIDDETGASDLPSGKIVVSSAYWQNNKDALSRHQGETGIMLSPEDDVSTIAADLAGFMLVVLQFPAFRDGRAYSQARILRQQYHYKGELRARGNVLRDQVMYMERVGFNSFEIDAKQDINDALKAFNEISIKYQSCSDEPLALYKRRAS